MFGRKIVIRYEPVGVVGVIGPWNYPLTNSFGDCIPALAAGNATVLKPATLTPNTSLLMLEGLLECGDARGRPPGRGRRGARVGNALIDAVDFVMFTGSTEIGIKVDAAGREDADPGRPRARRQGPDDRLADANLERAANAAVFYSMQNGGQTCISVERVYVEEPVYDEFVAKVDEKMRTCARASPASPARSRSARSPRRPGATSSTRTSRDATEKGARVLVGGTRHEGAATSSSRPARRRRPLDGVHDRGDVLADAAGDEGRRRRRGRAARQRLAVRAAGFGVHQGPEKGKAIARRLEAGAVCVNDACINYVELELPMGGWKTSGVGSRHGAGGIRKYTRQQTVVATRFAMKKEIHMYPYRSSVSNLIRRAVQFLYGRGKRD